MTTTREFDDDGLDAVFAEARDAIPPPLAPGFERRLLAQAEAAVPRALPRPGWLARTRAALAGIGGAPGLAGLSAAGLAGLWIGFAGPGPAADLASGVWSVALRAPDLSAFEAGDEDQSLLALIAGDSE